MPATFAVRHPSGKLIRFPQGTPDADVAAAMSQLDAPTAQPPDPEEPARPQPFLDGPHSEDYGEKPLHKIVTDYIGSIANPPKAAVVASSVGQTDPAKALFALSAARAAGVSPAEAALGADALREQAQRTSVAAALKASPALKAYAAQSPVHTDAIAPDATNLAAVGQGFFGESPEPDESDDAAFENRFTPEEESDQAQIEPDSGTDTIAQVLMKHTAGALSGFADAIVGLQSKPGEASKDASRALHQASDVDLSKEIPGPAEAVFGVAPSLAVYTAGGAAGKTALFGVAMAQNYGELRHAGVDDWIAAPASAAAASIFIVPGSKFVAGLLGKASEKEVQDAAAKVVMEIAKRPEIKAGLLNYGKHALSGYLMTVGQAMSNAVAIQLDRLAKTGKSLDPSELWQTFKDSSTQALALLPYAGIGPLREHFEAVGQLQAAHADQVKLAKLTGPLGETELVKQAPDDAKQFIKEMPKPDPDLDRVISDLRTARDEAAARGAPTEPWEEALRRQGAEERANTQAYVDAEAIAKAAKKHGLDPDKMAEQATGNPVALREAEATGNPVPIPIENYAVDLQPMHEDLSKGTSLSPDNPSLAKAPQPESLSDVLKRIAEPLNNAKLSEIAANGGPAKPPTEAEVRGLFETLKGLGFDVPEIAKAGGSGAPPEPPPPAGGAGSAGGGEPPKPRPPSARKVEAEEAIGNKTLNELKTNVYARSAERAQKEIDKLRVQVENKLASAEQTAQQGLDKAVDAAERAQQGVRRHDVSTDAALLNYLQGSEKAQQGAEDLSVRATEKTVKAGDLSGEALRQIEYRDANKALEAARVKALKESNKIQADVKKLAASPAREKVYTGGGQIYGQLYDHFMESVGLRKPVPNAALDHPADLMELLQASYGSDLPFDKNGVLDGISKGKALGDMKLAEARNARDFIEGLHQMAREASQAYVSGAMKDRADVIANDIAPALRAQNPDAKPTPLNPKQQVPNWFSDKAKEIKGALGDVAKNNFQTLLKPLGEWGPSHFLRTLGAEKARAQIDKQVYDALLPMSKLPNLDERLPWPSGVDIPGTISRADMLYARRLTGTMENARDIAKATGTQISDWEAWFDEHMTEDEYRATQHAWVGLKELGEQTAAVNANRAGVPMVRQTPRKISTKFGEFQGDYGGGMRWLKRPGELPQPVSEADPMQGNRVAEDTPHGLTETRVPVKKLFPDLSATNDRAHFGEQAHDIAFSEVIRDGARMLKDPALESAVTRYMGDEWYKRLVDSHNLMASGGRVPVDRGIGTVNAVYVGGRIVAGVAFPLNVNTGVKMLMHPLQDIAVQGDRRWLLHGVMRAVSPEGRAEANHDSRVVGLYTQDGFKRLSDMQRELAATSSGLDKIGNVASMAGTWFTSRIMAAQAHIVWQTHKYGALHDGASPQEAIDHADARTAAAMPANSVFRQSAQNRNQVFAALNLVWNFEGAFWNMKAQQEIERRAGVAAGENKLMSHVMQSISRTAAYAALGVGLWVGGQGRNPEEEKADLVGDSPLGHWTGTAQWAARVLMIEKFFGSPVMHKVMEVAAPIIVGEKAGRHYGVFSPPVDELFNSSWNDFTHAVNSDSTTPERLQAAFRGVARFVPGSTQITRTGRAAYELFGAHDFTGLPGPRGVGDMLDWLARGPRPRNSSLVSDIQGGVSGLPRQVK